jgi:ATP/maltotriose-dependent transcriptional regulator MalT
MVRGRDDKQPRTPEGRLAALAGSAPPDVTRITARECEILQLVALGYSNADVAQELLVSPATVKTHLENVYKKLGVRDRAAAVAHALRAGLIS